jgi:thymidylate kinase
MLITLSGMDGSGKSTQIQLLKQALERGGSTVRVRWLRPGYGPELDRARAAIRAIRPNAMPHREASEDQRSARKQAFAKPGVRATWRRLACADAILQWGVKVRVELAAGRVVIADRWWEDALLDLEFRFPDDRTATRRSVLAVSRLIPRPAHRILLMVPPDVSARRCAEKEEPYPDDHALRERRYAAYQHMAADSHHVVVDATVSVEAVHRAICEIVGVEPCA